VRTHGVGATFSLAEVVPEAVQVGQLVEELEQLAPEVLAWWRSADAPMKARLVEILTELQALLRRGP
jgi:hypothetical protein